MALEISIIMILIPCHNSQFYLTIREKYMHLKKLGNQRNILYHCFRTNYYVIKYFFLHL